jgi:hypothetical protein
MPKKEKNKKSGQKESIFNNAVQQGIEAIIEEHPKFANFQDYLLKHIDQKKIKEKFYELYEEASKKNMNEKDAKNHIYKELTNYVASGSVLDEKGKEVILKSGLEEKTEFFHKLFHPLRRDGEKYLNNTMEAFNDLYALFKSGDYAQRMPELTESVTALHDLNFLDPAVDVLKSYGLIDSKKHKFLKENIYNRVGEESKKVVGGIESYIVPQKIAASIIGLFGLILIISSLTITGAVTGTNSQTTIKAVGAFMIFLALLFFFKPLKKKL